MNGIERIKVQKLHGEKTNPGKWNNMFLKVKNIVYIFITIVLSILLFLTGYYSFQRIVKNSDFPTIFGYSIARVVSGSMQPELNINDIVIIKTYNDYYVGDIVTYNNNGSYITHRIVNILDSEKYVTKGDFNNTQDDVVVNKSEIQGKVVTHFGSIWNIVEYMWTFQGLCLLMFVTSLLTFLPYLIHGIANIKNRNNNDKNNKLLYSSGYMLFHSSILVLPLFTVILSMARITNVVNANDTGTVAKFTLGVDDTNIVSLNMNNLKPGDKKQFEISIKNKKDDILSQVAQDYNIFLKLCPKNDDDLLLPLTFSIKPSTTSTVGQLIPEEDIPINDSNIGQTSAGKIPASSSLIEHKYVVDIAWPEDKKDYKYQNQENLFEVYVKSKQLDIY